jgi:hypothetical protein
MSDEVLLDNERVRVRRFVIAGGASVRRSSADADHLWVIIKGGRLKSGATGRETLWREGRVIWCDGSLPLLEDAINSGASALEIVAVHLKPLAPSASPDARAAEYLNYPNIPGEDVLDNDRVIVQRFLVGAGEWEGVHAHQPNTFYIHVQGGLWAVRSKDTPAQVYDHASADSSVGWMPAIPISEEHQSGNAGVAPIDLIWVTLKG